MQTSSNATARRCTLAVAITIAIGLIPVHPRVIAQELVATPLEHLGVVTHADDSADLRFSPEFVNRRVTEEEYRRLEETGWELILIDEHPSNSHMIISFREVIAMREPQLNNISNNGHEVQLGPEQNLVLPKLTLQEKRSRRQWLGRRLISLTEDVRLHADGLNRIKSNSESITAATMMKHQETLAAAERGVQVLSDLRLRYQVEIAALREFENATD